MKRENSDRRARESEEERALYPCLFPPREASCIQQELARDEEEDEEENRGISAEQNRIAPLVPLLMHEVVSRPFFGLRKRLYHQERLLSTPHLPP